MDVWLIPGEPTISDSWCEQHACSKTTVELALLSEHGVSAPGAIVTICHRCADEEAE